MKITILFLSLIILFLSIRYGIYEIKEKNISGGITVCILGIFQSIFTNSIIFILNN